MLPFDTRIAAGKPASEQVISAVHRAVATGRLNPGDPFPSVRELSREVGINPNTAHKVVTALIHEGLLEVHPGLGTRVAARAPGSATSRARELSPLVEELVIQSCKLGASREEIAALLAKHWDKISPA
jgi:GntR family transcriptional regulator